MNTQDSQLVIRDTPLGLWFFGALFAGIGAFIFVGSGGKELFLLLFVVVGLAVLVLSSTLTITADRLARTLRLEYRSLLGRNLKEISFDEIGSIHIQRSVSHRRGRTSSTYRVAATLKSGEVVPFRSYYSSGAGSKEQQAEQLRAFIGIGGLDSTPGGLIQAVPQMVQAALQSQQQAVSGVGPNEMRETNGVHWQVQVIGMGASPLTRWHSPDFVTPGSFLYIAQKAEGQASGGFLASLGATLFRQSISMYGFRPDDTPGIDRAGPLSPLDPGLEPYFMAFSNDPTSARQTLNPWAVMPLADWARRHPLKQFQSGSGMGQLVVLVGPNGVYLVSLGMLQPDALDELTALGVELVRSQGSQAISTGKAW